MRTRGNSSDPRRIPLNARRIPRAQRSIPMKHRVSHRNARGKRRNPGRICRNGGRKRRNAGGIPRNARRKRTNGGRISCADLPRGAVRGGIIGEAVEACNVATVGRGEVAFLCLIAPHCPIYQKSLPENAPAHASITLSPSPPSFAYPFQHPCQYLLAPTRPTSCRRGSGGG